jgi:hypothetical protein
LHTFYKRIPEGECSISLFVARWNPPKRIMETMTSSVADRSLEIQPDHKRYFIEKLGLSERLMERCLGEALSAGGEYADLYFESVTSTSLGIDEGLVKTASQGISVGCGIRVLAGERTGFAYTDDLSSDRLLKAGAAGGERLPPYGDGFALSDRRAFDRRGDRRKVGAHSSRG